MIQNCLFRVNVKKLQHFENFIWILQAIVDIDRDSWVFYIEIWKGFESGNNYIKIYQLDAKLNNKYRILLVY